MIKITNIKHKLRGFWRPVKTLSRFLTNIWIFRKELWDFREWDHTFLTELWVRSLEIQRRFYASDRPTSIKSHTDLIAEQMSVLIGLLPRISDLDVYIDEITATGVKYGPDREAIVAIRTQAEEARQRDLDSVRLLLSEITNWWD